MLLRPGEVAGGVRGVFAQVRSRGFCMRPICPYVRMSVGYPQGKTTKNSELSLNRHFAQLTNFPRTSA